MSQAIVTTSALSSPGHPMQMPADLIFLINQASESLTARQLKIALTNWPKDSAPAVVSLSSETDSANANIWPIGLRIPSLFGGGGKMRPYEMTIHEKPYHDSQRTYYTKTTGQDPRQITHRICPAQPSVAEINQQGNILGEVVRTIPLTSGNWELRKAPGNEGADYDLQRCLRGAETAQDHSGRS